MLKTLLAAMCLLLGAVPAEAQPKPAEGRGHRQLVSLRSRWAAIRRACSWLRCSGDAGDLGPNLHGLGPGGSILGGGHLVTAEQEEVVDPIMG
jgi:hypothetical protein